MCVCVVGVGGGGQSEDDMVGETLNPMTGSERMEEP